MNSQMDQIKRLSWFLLASLSVNACLVSFIIYWLLVERPLASYVDSPLAEQEARPLVTQAEMTAALGALKGLTIEELISKLPDKRVVENGFTVGDLALATLTGYYYFDIERAVHHPLEKAVLAYGKRGETLVVYPALSEADFNLIEKFIRQEKWPYRAQGLYRLLKTEKFENDSSLKEAFFLTPEFLSVELLLSRSPSPPEKMDILSLMLSQDWGKLAAFYEKQRSSLDLSEGARRLYLLEAIEQDSAPAAKILLDTDKEFALKKLEDRITVKILTLLKDQSFAEELLKTPRSEWVKREAMSLVPEAEKGLIVVPGPTTNILSQVKPLVAKTTTDTLNKISSPQVQRLEKVPEKITLKAPIKKVVPQAQKERIYIVQKNDTLSKIAERFKIDIEILRKMNGMTGDQVKQGRPLRIPS